MVGSALQMETQLEFGSGGERADGGEDDEGEGEEQDLVEMWAGSPHPSPTPEHA